ncbi:hypothetical protein BVX98_07830 [bacterium F11]|nr:hypothetical protein BVX98_07830 [bacterium F11]
MKDSKPILIIGATGMLGRPVVRRLVQDRIPVRAMVRSMKKARAVLPKEVDLLSGDLRSVEDIDQALNGCGAVYVSVDTPPKAVFKSETDGLKNIIEAARRHGHPRLMVLSALGQSDPRAKDHPWWHVREKYAAQEIARSSRLPWTIFEPTWFMESLPLFIKGKVFSNFSHINMNPYWVAGDDHARLVSASLGITSTVEKIIPVQGPEPLTFEEAGRRFIAAYEPTMKFKTFPMMMLKMLGLFSADAKELATLFQVYGGMKESPPDYSKWPKLPKPSMTIEAYAGYCRATGDFPQK